MDWLVGLSDPHAGIAADGAPDTTKRGEGKKKKDEEGPEVGSETQRSEEWVPFSKANKGETGMISDLRALYYFSNLKAWIPHGNCDGNKGGTGSTFKGWSIRKCYSFH